MDNSTKITQAELVVMQLLWKAEGPLSTGEIYNNLSKQMGWDRSTVRTLLKRLTEKGAVEIKKQKVLSYLPRITQDEYLEVQTKSFLDTLYGGSVKRLVSSLVQNYNISSEDMDELRDFLNKESGNHE